LRPQSIWVVGEALIDLLHKNDDVYECVGGGPANTAIALSKLQLPTFFIGGISTDFMGKKIEKELLESGLNLQYAIQSKLPTAIAEIYFDFEGSPNYEFKFEGTATFDFGDSLPKSDPNVLYMGSLSTIIEPLASKLYSWASKKKSYLVYDPNVRSNFLSEFEAYKNSFNKWAKISNIIKLSAEDLKFLNYGIDEILDFEIELLVVTNGQLGLTGYTRSTKFDIPAINVRVVDTIGAGDTIGAVIVEGLLRFGENFNENLEEILQRATRAAAITCSREGAKPPTKDELD
jgi:fructokinase